MIKDASKLSYTIQALLIYCCRRMIQINGQLCASGSVVWAKNEKKNPLFSPGI